MSVLRTDVRPGGYYDSIVLMQLQASLAELPGILDAGAVMGTADNQALLEANDLLSPEAREAGPSDLVVVVKAEDEKAAAEALARVDSLLVRGGGAPGGEYRPRTLSSAVKLLPGARWALISVPGRFAGGVAGEALAHGLNVFLYSDNVPLAEEVALKKKGASEGRLVMGPDCGTAVIHGIGLGFANRVRRGSVGVVAASGTGLQAVCTRVHALGAGISHGIGTGGRDLDAEVGAITTLQGLSLLARDPDTRVIVLLSKPPVPSVARAVLAAARGAGKPVVVYFLGAAPPARRVGELHFATGLAEAAEMAAELAETAEESPAAPPGRWAEPKEKGRADDAPAGYLRGLFSGGTLAAEALLALWHFLGPLHSNLRAEGVRPLASAARSEGHAVLDLGADEFTVGRLHPMLDNDLRLRRLRQEAADPEVGLILLDVVLGDGAHADPASELAPAIAAARAERDVEIVAVVIGTEEDPQDLEAQVAALEAAGARVFLDVTAAVSHVVERLAPAPPLPETPVELEVLRAPPVAINIGVESFADSLREQGAGVIHVEWRPPAGGDERLAAILDRLRG